MKGVTPGFARNLDQIAERHEPSRGTTEKSFKEVPYRKNTPDHPQTGPHTAMTGSMDPSSRIGKISGGGSFNKSLNNGVDEMKLRHIETAKTNIIHSPNVI